MTIFVSNLLLCFCVIAATATAVARPLTSYNQSASSELIFVPTPGAGPGQVEVQPFVSTPGPIPVGEAGIVSQIWPDLVSYSQATEQVDTAIQGDLRPTQTWHYKFIFQIGSKSGKKKIPVPPGWYQIQLAVIQQSGKGIKNGEFKDPLDRYVTSKAILHEVSGNSFTKKISLTFPRMTMTALRHHLFVELIPVNEDKCKVGEIVRDCLVLKQNGEVDAEKSILEARPGFKSYMMEIPFVPHAMAGGQTGDYAELKEEDVDFLRGESLAKYVGLAALKQTRPVLEAKPPRGPTEHAQENHLTLIDANDRRLAPASEIIKGVLDHNRPGIIALKNDRRFVHWLCQQMVRRNPGLQAKGDKNEGASALATMIGTYVQQCVRHPESFMRLSRVTHAGKVLTNKAELSVANTLNLSIMQNFMATRSSSVETSTGVSWGLKNNPLSSIAVKMMEFTGLNFNHSLSFSNIRAHVEAGLTSLSRVPFDFNYFILDVTSFNSRRCLEIRALPEAMSGLLDSSVPKPYGLYICDEQKDMLITPEIYAHVFKSCKVSTLACDQLAQSVNGILRGDREISAFFYALRKEIRPENKKSIHTENEENEKGIHPFVDMPGAESYFASTPQMSEGEIINPVHFPSEVLPDFFKLVPFAYQEKF